MIIILYGYAFIELQLNSVAIVFYGINIGISYLKNVSTSSINKSDIAHYVFSPKIQEQKKIALLTNMYISFIE
jgi:hypothetical protein